MHANVIRVRKTSTSPFYSNVAEGSRLSLPFGFFRAHSQRDPFFHTPANYSTGQICESRKILTQIAAIHGLSTFLYLTRQACLFAADTKTQIMPVKRHFPHNREQKLRSSGIHAKRGWFTVCGEGAMNGSLFSLSFFPDTYRAPEHRLLGVDAKEPCMCPETSSGRTHRYSMPISVSPSGRAVSPAWDRSFASRISLISSTGISPPPIWNRVPAMIRTML